jgi:uncharacterized protein
MALTRGGWRLRQRSSTIRCGELDWFWPQLWCFMLVLHLFLLALAASQASSQPNAAPIARPDSSVEAAAKQLAISNLRSKAEAGDAQAQSQLANAYETGSGIPADVPMAALWYKKSAEQGNPAAENSLGTMYRLGQGVEKNKKESVRWYRKAAQLGNSAAMFNLGTCYYNGDGVEVDDSLSTIWFFLAEQAGDRGAGEAVARAISGKPYEREREMMLAAAGKYEKGDEVPQDAASALKLYRKVADNGSSDAQVRIANMLIAAAGPGEDYTEASQRCHKAAKAKYPPGEVCLGVLYKRGLGVAADPAQAVTWFDRGAEGGDPVAMLYLGQAYWKGEGVGVDRTKAYMWLLLASSFSVPDAKAEEPGLRQEISATEAEKAKQQAQEWAHRHSGFVIKRR